MIFAFAAPYLYLLLPLATITACWAVTAAREETGYRKTLAVFRVFAFVAYLLLMGVAFILAINLVTAR